MQLYCFMELGSIVSVVCSNSLMFVTQSMGKMCPNKMYSVFKNGANK